jgi:hypothetical protein
MTELVDSKDAIRRQLNTLHISHVTIEFEFPGESCAHVEC